MPQTSDSRRAALRALAGTALLTLVPMGARSATLRSVAVQLDGLYIPALFLTGSAGKSDAGPAKARAAMARLQQQWPSLHAALKAQLPRDADWHRVLDAVQGHIATASRQVEQSAWPESHETLEQIRLALFKARRARGIAYLLDDFTAFHGAMEEIANAPDAGREALLPRYAHARALWRVIETAPIDAAAWGLSAARATQLRRSLDDEGQALSRLSAALQDPAAGAALPKAAGAIKGPFVQAYTAFGWPVGETPDLPA